jgi:hypothetical protein
MDLPYPFGTDQHHVFPQFNLSNTALDTYKHGNTLKINIEVFTFDMQCQGANVTFGNTFLNSTGTPRGHRLIKRPVTPLGDAENWYTETTLSTSSWSATHLILDLAGPRFGDLERWSGLWVRPSPGRDHETRVSAIVSHQRHQWSSFL